MGISREHQWDLTLRNQVEQVSILCFIGETRDFLHGISRTGKARNCRGVKRFVDECLKKIPEGIREIFLRADSGFYDGDFLNHLEMRRVLYAIVVKLYPWIQIELIGLKYRDIGGGISVSEIMYTAIGWKESRRMGVIREEERHDKRKMKQPTLFELMGYSYKVIVTNIEEMLPEEVWRFYNGRANVENMKKRNTILFIGCEYIPFLWSQCRSLPFGYACIQFNELI
jgi:hypothetical protein